MAKVFADTLARTIDGIVRVLVIPVTRAIPVLISSGVVLVGFGILWAGFAAALLVDPRVLDETWAALGRLPLAVQGLAWLLGLPLMVGLWVLDTDWPLVVRLAVIAGVAGWNLLVLFPRRQPEGAEARS
jgi:hypothetical protein